MLLVGLSLCARAQIRDTLIIQQSEVSIELDGDGYHHVYYGNEYVIDEGVPALPIVTKQYYIPKGTTDIQIEISSLKEESIDGVLNIYPSQGKSLVGEEGSSFITLDSIWKHNSYPNVLAEITSIDYLLGHQIATVTFYPFAYIGNLGIVQVRDISVSLNYTIGTIVENDTIQSSYRESLCKGYVKNVVENPELLDACTLTNSYMRQSRTVPIRLFAEGRPVPDFIIITNEELKSTFSPLAEWKTRRGVFTVVETVENIANLYKGYDLCEQIRNYLIEKESQWGNGLCILLGGGIDIIPSRYYTGTYGLEVSDLYYVDRSASLVHTTGNRYYSISVKSMIGRFPVDNVCEAKILVDKVIDYEKAANYIDYNYIDNTLVANAFLGMSVGSVKTELTSGAMNEFYNYVKNTPKNYWFQYDMFNRHSPDTIDGIIYEFDDAITGLSSGEELTRQNFLGALVDGRGESGNFHLVFHLDHSEAYNMGTSSKLKNESIERDDIENLQFPLNYYQVIFSMGCHPADFSKQCIGKSFLMKPQSGAVAFMSNTDIGWGGESTFVEKFYQKMYGNNKWDWESTLGPAWLNVVAGSIGSKGKFHLLGDPTMHFWTEVPEEQDIQMSMNGSTFFLTVTRPDKLIGKGGTICVYKENEVYLIDTLFSRKDMTFYLRDVKTSGYVYVTSTGLGLKPHMDSIYIDMGEPDIMDVIGVELSDELFGNGDGVFSAGETIDLRVTYESNCSTSYNVPVMLSSEDVHVEIVTGTYDVGKLRENGYTVYANFSFRILPDSPDLTICGQNNILFNLNCAVNGDTYCLDHFYVEAKNPKWELVGLESQLYSDDDTLYEIYVEFMQVGSTSQMGYDFNIYNRSEYPIEIIDTAIIEHTGEKMSVQFLVRLNEGVDYSDAFFEVEVKSQYGHESLYPIMPFMNSLPSVDENNNVKLIAESDYIDICWNFSDGYKFNIYVSTDGTQFTQLNDLPVSGNHFRHTSLAPFTTYYYQIEPILWGVLGERSMTYTATTTSAPMNGFPKSVNGNVAFRGQLNSWDVDMDGQHEVFGSYWNWATNKNGIIAIRPDGTDLYEDFIPSIMEPMATTSRYYMNGVAVGELYDDAVQYVVSSTYTEDTTLQNNVICYSLADVNGDTDGFPSIHWEKMGTSYYSPRSPIIADLDGDNNNEVIVPSAKGYVKAFDADGSEITTINAAIGYKNLAIAKIRPGDERNYLIVPNGRTLGVYNSTGTSIAYYSVSLSGFVSTPVICDYDKDGYKEAIFADLICYNKKDIDTIDVYSVKYRENDVVVSKLFSDTTSLNSRSDVPFAVGDLNSDSYLEIVLLTSKHLWIYDNRNPNREMSFNVIKFTENYDVPIIADVNGDGFSDIIYQEKSGSTGRLKAVDYYGNTVPGFSLPLHKATNDALMAADIDNDEITEIVCATSSGNLFIWKTNGCADDIQWGYSRGDVRNTGEYGQVVYPDVRYSGTYPFAALNRDLYIMGNVTIKNVLTFDAKYKIVVWGNGVLNIDGATLNNARIVVKPGGKVNINNGATINLRDAKSFVVPHGAQLEIEEGIIK